MSLAEASNVWRSVEFKSDKKVERQPTFVKSNTTLFALNSEAKEFKPGQSYKMPKTKSNNGTPTPSTLSFKVFLRYVHDFREMKFQIQIQ